MGQPTFNEATLNDEERRAIIFIGEYRARKPGQNLPVDELLKHVGVDQEKWRLHMFGRMAEFRIFNPSVNESIIPLPEAEEALRIVQVAEAARQAPQDIVESIKRWARRKPFTAWAIVVFSVATALASLINNVMGIYQKIWGK